ncbi:MAG: helix-turn-helix domain-containing protein [Gammaproteobacteria bacterium]|nr:helix-turn-helix domain-containing protein [Gammaproteobacteria bacterium]
MTDLSSFNPDWVSPPGDTVSDLLEERNWSQTEFARRAGYTEKHVSLLIRGKLSITEDTAIKLERTLGSTARFWLAREAQYRESLMRDAESKTMEQHKDWLAILPLKDKDSDVDQPRSLAKSLNAE